MSTTSATRSDDKRRDAIRLRDRRIADQTRRFGDAPRPRRTSSSQTDRAPRPSWWHERRPHQF